ncbi:hypothetical protein KUCAC02_008892 [Chaenocephalus aceratus]|uniref:Uncharacterized protein n=1 Tax=Chaenocephalus aceratus TaxID=36190 RepID=A0ACB9WS65_CHAAC|nr:hypothetical protein KUCAC02_008892 [Chaenocephalus aceratus]
MIRGLSFTRRRSVRRRAVAAFIPSVQYFFTLRCSREQELKVHQARRSLEEALMADGLARATENTRELLEGNKA